MNNYFHLFKDKMEVENLPKIVIDTFEYYYNKLLGGETGIVSENEILPTAIIPAYDQITNSDLDFGESISSQSVIIKLNGGLGTSMGLSEAKSLLKVKNNYTFLDIIANQAIKSNIPLLLMNSYNTQEKSLELLKRYENLNQKISLDFLQHKIPKINTSNYKPAEYASNQELEWCPPGHGEVYTAMVTSGILDTLLSQNIHYAFISNSDNLGAVMDYRILGYFAKNSFPFLMEVAARTEADKKGGHLAKRPNGNLLLRETAQCSKEDVKKFQDVNIHKFFNTNNLWINLPELKRIMTEKKNILNLPMIVNKKNVNPKDPQSQEVYQLETAMGSAISVFKGASALEVPRTRFAPVKTTEDLLSVRSDNYVLDENFNVLLNPKRTLSPILINLDKKYYKLVDDLDARIPIAPSLVKCKSLTIKGEYILGAGVKFKGEINLLNETDTAKTIEENSEIID